MARTLILIGVIFIFMGFVVYLINKIPGVGRLPGDILIKRENFSFYFPLTTCMLTSLILSLIFYFINNR
jgi:hypothetical protein